MCPHTAIHAGRSTKRGGGKEEASVYGKGREGGCECVWRESRE